MTEFFLHYGTWTYLILFLVIFSETGFVVTPFLPGDSLIFAASALAAAAGSLNIFWLFILLALAAVLGDTVNYWIGHFLGPKIFYKENVKLLNKKYLEEAHKFYEKHGGKTIIFARFIPVIRTFAPFVAGIGEMNYGKFLSYNIFGGVGWVALFTFGGYYFGTIPAVQKNFTLVIAAIILISISPAVVEYFRHKKSPVTRE